MPFDAIRSALPEGVGFYGGDFGAPEGFVDPNSEAFTSRLDRHAKSVIQKGGYVKAEDAESDDYFAKLARKRGIELGDDLKPVTKLDQNALSGYHDAWAEEHLNPVKSRAEELERANAALRQENTLAKTQGALLGEFRPEVFESKVPGVPSKFEMAVKNLVGYDEETGAPYFDKGNGIRETDVAKALLEHFKKHDPESLADKRQRGAGPGGQPGGGGGDETMEQRAERLRKLTRR